MGVIFGLLSGVSWGVADFCGGLASKRMAAAAVAFVTQVIGTTLVIVAIAVTRPTLPPWPDLALGALGGVFGGLGVFAFYKALSIGTMSLVAPVSALGAGVPMVFGLLDGERPSNIVLAGALVALTGAVLASHAPGHASRRGLGLAAFAAFAFGAFFVLIAPAAESSVLWAGLSTRVASVPVLLAVCLGLRASVRVDGGVWPLLIPAGALDIAANVAYAEATQHGLLSIVAVLSGLYPVATVILAQIVLKERLSQGQAVGVMAALVGVGFIAAG
jgi:drug/metabolite transporter (DMT)-like permease